MNDIDADKRTYGQKLKDSRWQQLRLKSFDAAQWTCEECLTVKPKDGLQLHHVVYLPNVEPWDHPPEVLMVLCEGCHEKRHEVERQLFVKFAQVIKRICIEQLKTMPIWYMFEETPIKTRKQ
jgi:5-methylcytosine-specific restriction endonuclease McrA